MALAIRLRKPGKAIKGRRHYKIVVDEKYSKINGKFVAEVGYYDPSKQPLFLDFNVHEYDKWVAQGAKPSSTVATLYKKYKKSAGNPVPERVKKSKAKTGESVSEARDAV